MSDVYFASESTERIGTEIKALIDRYYVFMSQSGFLDDNGDRSVITTGSRQAQMPRQT